MNIEIAVDEDLPIISEINRQLDFQDGFWSVPKGISKYISEGDYFVLRNGAVYAAMSVGLFVDGLEIVTLAVREDQHGRGYGSRMVSFSENYARALDIPSVFLFSSKKLNAKEFYLNLGYDLCDCDNLGDFAFVKEL